MTSISPCELTVVIASCNRREMLHRCLSALDRQSQDPETFEIVVADDGSTDGSAEMVEELHTGLQIRVLRLDKGGKSPALNAAIDTSEAAACLILDDDIIASQHLVAEHIAAHRADPRLIGIGPLTQQPPAARDWYAEAFATAWNEHYEELEQRPARWTDCYGGNLSAPRSALTEVGGLSTDLTATADIELAYRLCRVGCVPTYLPGARGVHDDQKRGDRMLEDRQRYAAAYIEIADKHRIALSDVLGRFRVTDDRWVALRRLLIAIRVPPAALASMGRFIPGSGRKMVWLHFVSKLALWGSIRRNVSHRRWIRITDDGPAADKDVAAAQSTQ